MNNKVLFIKSYLEKISKKFEIDENKAFEVFAVAALLDKSFDEVFDDVIIKNGDRAIDAIFFNEQEGHYVMEVFQCKNSDSLKQTELDDLKQIFNAVFIQGRTDIPNTEGIIGKLDEYRSITKKGFLIEHRLNFVFNGDVMDEKNTANNQLFKSYNKSEDHFFIIDSNELDSKISSIIKQGKKRNEVKFTFNAEKSNISSREPQAVISYSVLNVKAINFRLSLLELCKLVDLEIKLNGSERLLFSDNVRGFLDYNKTNQKIRETLENNAFVEYFPLFNNGITMLCSEMKIPVLPQAGEYIIPAVNPVIVNGLQTTKVIYNFYMTNIDNPNKLNGIYVNIRLYETKDPEIIDKITEATNTQSPINFKDKISNKEFQDFTKELFANKGIRYISKRGEIFDTNNDELKDSVTSEKVIKFWYASFYEKPEIAKNSISKVLEEVFDATNEDNPLQILFNGNKNSQIYLQLFVAYKLSKIIALKKKSITNDFIEHSDELLAYGIFKKITIENKPFSDTTIEEAYADVFDTIENIVKEEKEKRKQRSETYSHNSYFKSSKCRIDYDTKKDIIETHDLIAHLLKLQICLTVRDEQQKNKKYNVKCATLQI